ncbi:M20 family metallopeptidase [Saccharothrix australiensis]|uniref:Glutamate carboxypeptidase n=1 Tax=Saccharothrix australiensis TaxID=2072 RepID=A0A495VZ99_9PSEU|nr:M20 family metallopeptidase [Saccharothrix australiensis]RKT53705.1 glutamate carboxypeptidase [Saccharothrix australiensis]
MSTPLELLTARRRDLVDDLALLVGTESPSDDRECLDRMAALLARWSLDRLPGATARRQAHGALGDVVEVLVEGATPDEVLVLGHYDTVWPRGTLDEWPFAVADGIATGPGAFDMKAGLVQAVWAVAALRDLGVPAPTVRFLFTPDEEIGSKASRPVIERAARGAAATLVLEPGVAGRVKTRRKGIGLFHVDVRGVEVHAGLDPEKGASAVTALAEVVLALRDVAAPDRGTTVNVGVISGGTRTNVVAGHARAEVDVRVATEDEARRVDRALAALRPTDPRVELVVGGDWNRPPMNPHPGSVELLGRARAVAAGYGRELGEVAVGGASDGNFVSAAGCPVLDGLGAVGDGAHARTEHVVLDGMPYQAALVAGLLADLAARPIA